jgi:hypothetical protein
MVVAACLADSSAEVDVEEFKRLKKIRDSLFHDLSKAAKSLPIAETTELLQKYLRLHIKKRNA